MKQQANTTYKLVNTPVSSPSETTIIDESQHNSLLQPKTRKYSTKLKYAFGLLLPLLLIGFSYTLVSSPSQTPQSVFKFQVYCPISYYAYLESPNDQTNTNNTHQYGPYQLQPSSLQDTDFNANQTYIITIISTQDDSGNSLLQFCSLAREWNKKCTEATYTCTSPGPMFDLLAGSTTDVVWINKLDPEFVPSTPAGSCLDPTTDPAICTITYTSDTQIFKSPTKMHEQNHHSSLQQLRISAQDWPSSIHIHGLQIRPQFDGNPLSWISNSGKKGEGIIPLDKQCYFKNFNKSKQTLPPNIKFTNPSLNSISKTNRYMNGQNPGNLWYHDHAMRLTLYNNANGLAGIYIIRDPNIQKRLPTGPRQKFILKTVNGWANQSFTLFQSDVLYRYRILNSDFASLIEVSFTSGDCSQPEFPTIPFTLIGVDSSLFNTTMPNISKIQLGPAERAEILISFNSSIDSFQICSLDIYNPEMSHLNHEMNNKPKTYKTVSTHKITPSLKQEQNSQTDTAIKGNQVEILNVPFINYTLIEQKDIRRFRMRPLMKNSKQQFLLNGHYDFHKGVAQNPQIGSFQDWYFINTLSGYHPMHVHLSFFQVVETLQLRYIYNTNNPSPVQLYCTFYEMDYLLQAIILSQNQTVRSLLSLFVYNGIIDYQNFCDFFKGGNFTANDNVTYNWDDYYYGGIELSTYSVNKQDEYDPQTRVSGINLRELIQPNNQSYTIMLYQSNCPQNTVSKYICGNTTINKPWYQRFKDTALINPVNAFRYRISWTKTNYTKGGPYFQAPIDHMLQFPGFVYHCHILDHEDDQMMRSIMLQPPQDYQSQQDQDWKCNQATWEDKFQCLTQECALQSQQEDRQKSHNGPTRRLQKE